MLRERGGDGGEEDDAGEVVRQGRGEAGGGEGGDAVGDEGGVAEGVGAGVGGDQAGEVGGGEGGERGWWVGEEVDGTRCGEVEGRDEWAEAGGRGAGVGEEEDWGLVGHAEESAVEGGGGRWVQGGAGWGIRGDGVGERAESCDADGDGVAGFEVDGRCLADTDAGGLMEKSIIKTCYDLGLPWRFDLRFQLL